MLDAFKALFARDPVADVPASGGDGTPYRVRLAACALLLEVAHADDHFTADERAHIEDAMRDRFALTADDARALLTAAEEARREAVDLHGFTSVLTGHYDDGERVVIAEMLWRVVAADGRLSPHEEAFTRGFRRWLDLDPGRFAEARRRALGDRAGA